MGVPTVQPKYLQLSERLLRRIEEGEWTVGDRLPSETLLAKEYDVAYMTVRSAVSALVEVGRLRRIRGRGTFVVEHREASATPVLGLLLPPRWYNLDPFYFPQIVSGFTDRAGELGYRVHLGDRSEPLLEFIRLREHKVSAVACVMLHEADVAEAEGLLDRGVVVVAVNHYRGSRRIAAVSPDNRGGSAAAARALLARGHRQFGYLAGPADNLDAHQRLLGIRSALRDAGVPARALRVLPGEFNEASGYERARSLVASGNVPEALMAASDLSALGAIKGLTEAGLRVPADVSVVGFGNFRPSAYTVPTLATVDLPLEKVGARASELLIEQAKGNRVSNELLPCAFLERESIALRR